MWAQSKWRIWDPVDPPWSTFECSWSTFEYFFWPQSGSDPIQSLLVDLWVHWVWLDLWLSTQLDLKSPKCYSFITLISRWVCLRILKYTGWNRSSLWHLAKSGVSPSYFDIFYLKNLGRSIVFYDDSSFRGRVTKGKSVFCGAAGWRLYGLARGISRTALCSHVLVWSTYLTHG